MLVAEYNKMIRQLEESAQLLARSERESAWREMAKQIAHEIKNPLTPMKLSIQYLQRALDEDSPNTKELAGRVSKTLIEQIDNLSEIATAFSSFAKMPKAKNEVMDLVEVVNGVVDLFKKEENVTIQMTNYTEKAIIYADKNQLISAFNNLVKNATQAIPEDRDGKIDVIVLEEYGHFKVVVMDNGSGIPEHQQDKVFVPNFTTKNSGTGLGLAITKRVVESARGRIWFESTENKGTTFYVELPMYNEEDTDQLIAKTN